MAIIVTILRLKVAVVVTNEILEKLNTSFIELLYGIHCKGSDLQRCIIRSIR